MRYTVDYIRDQYTEELDEIVSIQRREGRESMFFLYEDGSTSEIFKGESTYIQIPKDKQREIFNSGDVVGSVHTHPAGFDPSTIDLMTAVRTNQEVMGVAVPIKYNDGTRSHTLSLADLSDIGVIRENMLFRSMRRSSFGVTDTGRSIRKQINLQRSGLNGSRSHKVVKEGIELPAMERPSYFNIKAGKELGVVRGDDMFLD